VSAGSVETDTTTHAICRSIVRLSARDMPCVHSVLLLSEGFGRDLMCGLFIDISA